MFACASSGLLLQEYQQLGADAPFGSCSSNGGSGGTAGSDVAAGRDAGPPAAAAASGCGKATGAVCFIGASVPHLLLCRPTGCGSSGSGTGSTQGAWHSKALLCREAMRGFAGMEVRLQIE